MSSQIKAGAIISYVSIGINILIGLLYTPWMISSIGKEDYGIYILATSVITIFLFDFGLGSAVTRFISRYLAEKRVDKVNKFLGIVAKLYLSIDLFFVCILSGVYFFIPEIYKELTPDEIEKFKVVYVIVASYSILSFPFIPLDGVITAHEKFVQLKLAELFNKIFVVVTMAACLWVGYGLYALVLVNTVAGILTILIKLVVIRKCTEVELDISYRNKNELKEIASYSGWVTVTALAQRLIFNIAPTILGIVSGSVEIAVFGIAMTFEGYVFSFANALNGLFLPRVTHLTLNDDGNSVLPLMIRVGRIQIFIIGLLILGFVGVGHDFINLWIGPDFSSVYECTIFLIIPSFFFLPQLIGSNAILAQNKVKSQAYVFLIMGLFNVIVGYFLADRFGALGFSISVFLAYTIRTIGTDIIFKRNLNIDVLSFFKESFLSMSQAVILALIMTILIYVYIPADNWVMFCVKAMLVVLSYLFSFWFFGFKQDEKAQLLSSLRKIFSKGN
jgi:O-antigen/teichoic acid export membrane protein